MAYNGKKYEYREEVTCKDCGKVWMKTKDIPCRRWQGRCQPCAARFTGKQAVGVKHTEQHRINTGLASKGRKHSPEVIERMRQRRGPNNPSWNPNREEVARKERARREMYSLVHNTFKRLKFSKRGHSIELLGYSAEDLHRHITSQFKDGMNWDNRGAWHIDHIKPVVVFIEEGITEPRIINALSNLTVLRKEENLSKGRKFGIGI